MDPNHNASIQGDIQLTILSLLYSGCSRRLHLKCMCYRGAVEHLGRQQGDLKEIENSQMQDCLWLSVQDVPCVQKYACQAGAGFLLLMMHTCVGSSTATSATGILSSAPG